MKKLEKMKKDKDIKAMYKIYKAKRRQFKFYKGQGR